MTPDSREGFGFYFGMFLAGSAVWWLIGVLLS